MVLTGFPRRGCEQRFRDIHASLCAEPFESNGHHVLVTCSIGASWYRFGVDDQKSLIERADRALYAAKGKGRNRVETEPTENPLVEVS